MNKGRRNFSNEFKSKVALADIKGDMTMSELCSQLEVQPQQVNKWKKQALEGMTEIFSDKRKKDNKVYSGPIDLDQ